MASWHSRLPGRRPEASRTGGSGCTACLVYDRSLTGYNFGPAHPMQPTRVDLTVELAEALGVVGSSGLPMVAAPDASDAALLSVHQADLIQAVQRVSADPSLSDPPFGLGTDDNPVFARMHQASRHVVGASVEAARRVWSGQFDHAANIAGGLHHAMPAQASGFCVYNDVAVAIQWLLDNGAERVAYVDVDVHHGDGVQRIFYNDPRVLTISLHETGQLLFPGTGFPDERGGPRAIGTSVNVALPPGTGDGGWLRAFHAVVPPLVRAFAPDVLVTQHGCDSHQADPLAHLTLTVDGQQASYQALHDLAHEVCSGKWVATGGGGYAVMEVVPRAWTHLLAVLAGRPLATELEIPESWRREAEKRVAGVAPRSMGDGGRSTFRPWSEGYDPDVWLDRAVAETRRQLFPEHGLDPLLD